MADLTCSVQVSGQRRQSVQRVHGHEEEEDVLGRTRLLHIDCCLWGGYAQRTHGE